MHDADDFDAVPCDAIQDQVCPDDEVAEARSDVATRRTKLRVLRNHPTGLVDAVEQRIRRPRIVPRDMVPDVDEVLPRALGAPDAPGLGHPVSVRCAGGARPP